MTLMRWFARDLDVQTPELARATLSALLAAPFVLAGLVVLLALLFVTVPS